MSDGSSGDLSNCPFKKVSRGLKHMSFGEEHLKWSNLCDFFSHRGLLFYISFASSLAMAGSISHQEADESDESHRNKTPRSKTITHMRTMVLVYLPTIPHMAWICHWVHRLIGSVSELWASQDSHYQNMTLMRVLDTNEYSGISHQKWWFSKAMKQITRGERSNTSSEIDHQDEQNGITTIWTPSKLRRFRTLISVRLGGSSDEFVGWEASVFLGRSVCCCMLTLWEFHGWLVNSWTHLLQKLWCPFRAAKHRSTGSLLRSKLETQSEAGRSKLCAGHCRF